METVSELTKELLKMIPVGDPRRSFVNRLVNSCMSATTALKEDIIDELEAESEDIDGKDDAYISLDSALQIVRTAGDRL